MARPSFHSSPNHERNAGKVDREWNMSLTFRAEPSVSEEALALSIACTQITFPVYAAALFRENSR